MQKLKKAQNKMNAFSVFTNEYLHEYRNKNGRVYPGGFSAAINDPNLQSRWDSLSHEEKEEYKEKARAEKGRSRIAYVASLAAMPTPVYNFNDRTESADWDIGNDGFGAGARKENMCFGDTRQVDQRRTESNSSSRDSQSSQEEDTAANPVGVVGSESSSNSQPATNIFGSSSRFGQVRLPFQTMSMAASIISKEQSVMATDDDYETGGLENPDNDDEETEDLMGDVEEPTEEEKEIEPTLVATIVPPVVAAPTTAPTPIEIETVTADNIPYEDVDEDIPIKEVIPAAPADGVARTIPTPEIQEPMAAAPCCPVPDIQQPAVIVPIAPMSVVVASVPEIQQPLVVASVPEIQHPMVVAPMPQIQQPVVVAPMPEIQQVAIIPAAPMPQVQQQEASNANMHSLAQNTIGWTQGFRDDYFAQLRMPFGCRGLGRGQHFLPQMAALDNLMRDILK